MKRRGKSHQCLDSYPLKLGLLLPPPRRAHRPHVSTRSHRHKTGNDPVAQVSICDHCRIEFEAPGLDGQSTAYGLQTMRAWVEACEWFVICADKL